MKVTIHRYDPDTQRKWIDSYEVPVSDGRSLTVMDVLDYISSNLDHTLAYYKHSTCNHGICGRCSVRVNGAVKLACIAQVDTSADLEVAPVPTRTLIRDLVTKL